MQHKIHFLQEDCQVVSQNRTSCTFMGGRLGSQRVEMPSLIHQAAGVGLLPPTVLAGKKKGAGVVHFPCVPAHCERLRRQQKPFQFIYKPLAIFSSLIPGGPCRAQAFRPKQGRLQNSFHRAGTLLPICLPRPHHFSWGRIREAVRGRRGLK